MPNTFDILAAAISALVSKSSFNEDSLNESAQASQESSSLFNARATVWAGLPSTDMYGLDGTSFS